MPGAGPGIGLCFYDSTAAGLCHGGEKRMGAKTPGGQGGAGACPADAACRQAAGKRKGRPRKRGRAAAAEWEATARPGRRMGQRRADAARGAPKRTRTGTGAGAAEGCALHRSAAAALRARDGFGRRARMGPCGPLCPGRGLPRRAAQGILGHIPGRGGRQRAGATARPINRHTGRLTAGQKAPGPAAGKRKRHAPACRANHRARGPERAGGKGAAA